MKFLKSLKKLAHSGVARELASVAAHHALGSIAGAGARRKGKKRGRFAKGSAAAKQFMSHLRSLRR